MLEKWEVIYFGLFDACMSLIMLSVPRQFQQEFSLHPWRMRSIEPQLWCQRPSSVGHGLPSLSPLPSASGGTLPPSSWQGVHGHSIVLAPSHHVGLAQAINTIAKMIGVMGAHPEMGLWRAILHQRGTFTSVTKQPASDRSLHLHGAVSVNTSPHVELSITFQRAGNL